jgi:hypothetical protein
MAKITTTLQNSSTAWAAAAWDNGIPNAVDDIAQLFGDLTAARTLTIPAATNYTIGSILTNDPGGTFFDWNIAGSSATTSILNFQVSAGVPVIDSVDGGTYSVLLSGNQGLLIQGGSQATDRITISNVNNTLVGPLDFNYSFLTTISGKLTAATRISSNNSFTGVTYSGILGISGLVDLQSSGLNIRTTNIIGDLETTSELTSSNGSYVLNHPDTHNNSYKISAPLSLDGGVAQWGTANTTNITVQYSGLIFGVAPGASTSTGNTFALNNNTGTGSVIFRLSHPANTFTGPGPVASVQSTSDVVDARTIVEYNTIANSGQPSSVGAGTVPFMYGWRSSTYRCIGAGGASDRQLIPFGSIAGNYNLENDGTGAIVFNSPTVSTFGHWTVLGGSNLDLNTVSQPFYSTKPLVKDGTGRWCLSGEKRYLSVAAYNSGPKPWISSIGRSLINSSFISEIVGIVGGYLRFNPTLDLRHQSTPAAGYGYLKVYSGGALELNGYSIPSTYRVAETTSYVTSALSLDGLGPANNGALINISGSNSIECTTFYNSETMINVMSGAITFNNCEISNYSNSNLTITGSGQVTFTTSSRAYNTKLIQDSNGIINFGAYSTQDSTIINKKGTIILNSRETSPYQLRSYFEVSGGISQISSSISTRIFSKIILTTGSLVHTPNSNLELSGTILYSHTTASNIFSYSFPSGRTLNLLGGAGFGTQEYKTGSIDIAYNNSGNSNANIITEANSLLTIQTPYSSSAGRGFNKNGNGTVVLMSSSSYLGTNNLYAGVTIPKHKNAFGRSSLIVDGGILSTAADMRVQISASLTLDGGSVNFGSNV